MGCRDLNAFTSQEVFAGPYLDEPGVSHQVSEAYRNITNGFLAFPLCVPGTAVWKGKQGRLYILKTLRGAAARAKATMQVWCPHPSCCRICHDPKPGLQYHSCLVPCRTFPW